MTSSLARVFSSLALALVLAACAAVAPQGALPRLYPEADRIFHADPRWLGGDAAISVPLGKGRILWLFGDSFIDPAAPYTRSEAVFIRNSVAIETGEDPRSAGMEFAWRADAQGAPASFFPEDGTDWFWPGGGVRFEDGTLALFVHRMAATREKSALGFAARGYAVVLVDNSDAPLSAWQLRRIDGPTLPFDVLPGAAVLRDGDTIIALALGQKGTHAGALMRYRAAALAAGDLTHAEWWAGSARGWLLAAALGKEGPAFVLGDAGAEASLHFDACARTYVHVASSGFGATDIAVREARLVTGPWGAPRSVFHPPESDAPSPFVYAGKAHAELTTPDPRDLAVTYVASSLDPDVLSGSGARTLYWPRFALVPAPPCAR